MSMDTRNKNKRRTEDPRVHQPAKTSDIDHEQNGKIPQIPNVPDPYDTGWKRLVVRLFFQFLEYLAPDILEKIDTTIYPEFLDKELKQLLPTLKLRNRNADMLVKVHGTDGGAKIILLHIEFQTQVDKNIGKRSFFYSLRIYEKFEIFPVTLIVLADATKSFRPERLEFRLNKRAGLTLDFPIIKILDYRERIEEFKQSNNVIEQVLSVYLECQQKRESLKKLNRTTSMNQKTQKKNQAQEWFTLKTEIMKRLHSLNIDEVFIAEVLWFLEWLIILPNPLAIEYSNLLYQEYEKKEGTMAFVSSFELYGREKGLQEGRQEGRQEGLQIGQVLILKKNISNLLDKKYGLTLDEQAKINSCEDLETLNAALETLVFSDSKDEVFSVLDSSS
jgi:hypothetical protein